MLAVTQAVVLITPSTLNATAGIRGLSLDLPQSRPYDADAASPRGWVEVP